MNVKWTFIYAVGHKQVFFATLGFKHVTIRLFYCKFGLRLQVYLVNQTVYDRSSSLRGCAGQLVEHGEDILRRQAGVYGMPFSVQLDNHARWELDPLALAEILQLMIVMCVMH